MYLAAVLRPVDGPRRHLPRRLPAAQRRHDSRAYETTLNSPLRCVRPVRPSDPPLGRAAAIRRVDHHPHGSHLLHWCVPPSARANWIIGCAGRCCWRCSRASSVTRSPTTCSRALGVRAASERYVLVSCLSAPGSTGHCSAVTLATSSSPHVRAAHPAVPGDHPGTDRRAPCASKVPEAHTVPRPGPHQPTSSASASSVFAAKAGAFFAITFGVLSLMAGVFQINPVWTIGPYNPAQVSAGSQPDIYMQWTDGLARLMPPWGDLLRQSHDPGDLLGRRRHHRRDVCRHVLPTLDREAPHRR